VSQTLDVSLGPRSYSIRIGPALLKDPGSYSVCRGRRALVVTDETVALHHLAPVLDGLGLSSEDALALPAGEAGKNWASVERIIDWLLSRRVSRDAVLIALGGGVTGDMTGFAAAIYQRGIDFIQLPTTLLAQVDSSVGGKTGINHPRGKNMIGAFHQPRG
jgi:3-dehydroquinate synthase